MVKRSTIIISFVLLTFFVAGGVEFFCRYLENALVADTTKNTATTGDVGLQTGRRNAAPQTYKSKVRVKTENYSIIVKRGLFGKIISKETVKKNEPPPVLKTTTIDFILLGTVTGEANVQIAIVKDKKKKTQDIYYQGDAIGTALLKEVRRGEVILTVRGKDEVLIMEELKSSSEGPASRPSSKSKPYVHPKKKTARIMDQASLPEFNEEILGGDDPEAFFEPPPYIPPTEQTGNEDENQDEGEDEETPPAAFSKRKMTLKKPEVID